MKFVVSAGGVPAGTYPAVFVGAEPFRDRSQQYGEGVKLRFAVTSGDFEGDEAVRIVTTRFTPRSNLFSFASSLIGRELAHGESFDFAALVGTRGLIAVEPTDGGATRVATFLRG